MAGGRHTQPLFDLIRRNGPHSAADDRATMNPGVGWRPGMSPRPVEPKPAGKPVVLPELKPDVPAPTREPDPEPTWLSAIGGSTVRMPVNAVYIASAVMVVLAVVGWSAGWLMANRRADQSPIPRPDPLITEPGESTTSLPADPTPSAPAPEPAKSAPSTEARSATGGVVITPKGMLQGDPRESGLNYLNLAQMYRTEAEAAVKFLSQNGLEAFAIPVDRPAATANNPDPSRSFYRLYAAKGISTDEYNKKMTARTNTEAAVARLGLLWQKEHRGSSNFSKPGWEKFK